MNRVREKVIFFIMIIQASVIGCIYLYCKMEKWNLEESMTIFLYPVFAMVLLFVVVISGLISFMYFIDKLWHAHKIYFCIPFLIVSLFFAVTSVCFNEIKLREYNFETYKKERGEIVELIMQGELIPDENGTIKLPEQLKNEEMARGGCVHIIEYGSQMGIYFCTFTGLLESSAGFVYLADNTFNDYSQGNLILQDQYLEDWYYCSTD